MIDAPKVIVPDPPKRTMIVGGVAEVCYCPAASGEHIHGVDLALPTTYALRSALTEAVETDADVVQALRTWANSYDSENSSPETRKLMRELADRVAARVEAWRKVLEAAE